MVKCVCFDCKSGYKSNREQDKANNIQFFKAPNDPNIVKEWQIATRILRDDIKLKPGDAVCSLHFNPEDIIREKVFRGLDGSDVATSPYVRPHLRKGAVPALKLGPPAKPAPKPRSLTLKREENGRHTESNICKKIKIEGEVSRNENDPTENVSPPAEPLGPFALLFKQMFENVNCVRMLISWMRTNVTWINRPGIIFFRRIGVRGKNDHVDSICNKEITIDDSMTILIKLNGKSIDHTEFDFETDQLRSTKDKEDVIEVVHNRNICRGCPNIILNAENSNDLSSFSYMDKVDTLRYKCCLLILTTGQEGKDKEQYIYCKTVKEFLRRKIIRRQYKKTSNYLKTSDLSPRKPEKIRRLRKTLNSTGRTKERAQARVRMLKKVVLKYEYQMMRISEDNVDKLIDKHEKISPNEKVAIKEIFKAAGTKDPRGRRYSQEWIILSLLLHLRSPMTYRMLHANKILPVPSVRTIRRYFSQMESPCGFDSRFFVILKGHFAGKSTRELHGVLLLGEMSTRKNLLLDRKTMTFKGVKNFGDNVPKYVEKEMADHGLVIMFQPLYDNYSQPIAVFVSKGPTHGDVLAKLVIQAIALLEKAGAKVHGIVADGGAPNRQMWTELGCSGKMESFKNSLVVRGNYGSPDDYPQSAAFYPDVWRPPPLLGCLDKRLGLGWPGACICLLKVYERKIRDNGCDFWKVYTRIRLMEVWKR